MYKPITPHERIKAVLSYSGLTQKRFAEKIGISQGYLSQMLLGKRTLSYETCLNIAKQFPINAHWLVIGEGEMLLSQTSMVEEPSSEYKKSISLTDLPKVIDKLLSDVTVLTNRLQRLEASK